MEGPYSARLPSARSGEKSRRAPAGRGTVNGRAHHRLSDARRRTRTGPAPVMSLMVESPDSAPPGSEFRHEPVMLAEIVELSAGLPAGAFVDATLGGAGHMSGVLAARNDLTGYGFDQDPDAIEAAAARLAGLDDRVQLHEDRFDRAPAVLRELGLTEIAGFLMDLGVSSPRSTDRTEASAIASTAPSTCGWTRQRRELRLTS